MLFLIQVTETGTGWEVQVSLPETPPEGQPLLGPARKLERFGEDGSAFPLPPAGDPDGLPAGLASDDLENAYFELMNQAAGPGGVVSFGRYLFNTLLGRELWTQIDQLAGVNPIELSLAWEAGDIALGRLPWEAMHYGDSPPGRTGRHEGFVAGDPEVAITRRVPEATAVVKELPSPPKILFVVGSDLTDDAIRPGAEYLGLLRNLRRRDLFLNTRLLLDATTESLEEALEAFQPNVVHFICHGTVEERGEVALQFRAKGVGGGTAPVGAARLLQLLRTEKNLPLPPVVVLNACSTALPVDPAARQKRADDRELAADVEVGRPMAAKLVAGGIPIVIGMSGQVADQACRLFTRGFYQALLEGGDIAHAAARGRRAAIAHADYDPGQGVDWALPALFLSGAMGPAKLDLDLVPAEAGRGQAAAHYLTDALYPVFLGRWEFFKQYSRLIGRETDQFMAITVSQKDKTDASQDWHHFGRTRLLKELAAQAVRDGHVPILITKELVEKNLFEQGNWLSEISQESGEPEWPRDFKSFLKLVVAAAYETRDAFKQNIPVHHNLDWSWDYFVRLMELQPGDPLPADLPDDFRKDVGLEPSSVKLLALAFRLDLLRLLDAVSAGRSEKDGKMSRLLLLIDDLHQMIAYSRPLLALLFDTYGLRGAKDRIRVIFTYSTIPTGEQVDTIKLINQICNTPGVVSCPLEQLHTVADTGATQWTQVELRKIFLLYRHFLLHWRYNNQQIPLACTRGDDDEFARYIFTEIASKVRGYPGRLNDDEVNSFIDSLSRMPQTLSKADDEQMLADLDARHRKRGS